MKRETTAALYLQMNAGNFLMPSYSMPLLTQHTCVVHDRYDLNISRCTRNNKQGLGCCFVPLLNHVCSFWSMTETGMGCTNRPTFLTAQIRNCWNADSVCLQCDTEHSTPCRHRVVFMDCVRIQCPDSESQRRSLIGSPVWLLRVAYGLT